MGPTDDASADQRDHRETEGHGLEMTNHECDRIDDDQQIPTSAITVTLPSAANAGRAFARGCVSEPAMPCLLCLNSLDKRYRIPERGLHMLGLDAKADQARWEIANERQVADKRQAERQR